MARLSSLSPGGYLTPILLLPALLLGGGSTLGLEMDGWLSGLAAAPIAALFVAHFLGVRPMHRAVWPILALIGGVFILGLLQLFGSNDGLWWDSPSRANARAGLELAGLSVDGPWSLTPDDTRMFLLRWLYPLAILLSVAGADPKERHRTLALIGILAILAVVLTMAQQVSPALLPYQSDTGSGVGWFANPNHHGLFLACGLVAALLALPTDIRPTRRQATGFDLSRPLILTASAVLVIGMATMLTGSRAALPLFLIALALALLSRPHHSIRPAWFTIGLIALPIIVALGLLLPRYVELAFTGPSIAEDTRWAALPIILDGAWEAMPWGTGFGSFDRVYRGLEPTALLGDRALNEAHNEIAQWLLEGGLGGLALLILFVALLWKYGRTRLQDGQSDDVRILRAGAIVVGLIAIHSLIDYPTRTVALGSLAMAALALWLIPPPRERLNSSGYLAKAGVMAAVIAALPVSILFHQPFAQRDSNHSPTDGRGLAENARKAALGGDPDVGLAKAALRRAPLEASAFETLALATSDDRLSNQYIDAGLALSRRAGVLPSLKFQRLLADSQYDDAVDQALILLRRTEPDSSLLRAVRVASLNDTFAEGLAAHLEVREHWITPIFSLGAEADRFEIDGVRALLLTLPPLEEGPPPHLVQPILAKLLESQRYEDSVTLYRALYPSRSVLAETPYSNARSRTDTTRFDWRLSNTPGLRSSLRNGQVEISGRGRTDEAIGWRFLALPSGRYRLSFQAIANGDEGAVITEISCANGSTLAQDTQKGRRERALDFTIDEACPLALIRLRAVPTVRPYRIVLDRWRIERLPDR